MNLKFLQTTGRKLVKYELIEVIIPGGSTKTRFQLPNNPNLRNTYIWHIETFFDLDCPISIITPTPTIPITTLMAAFLSLQMYDGDNFVWQKPLLDLHTLAVKTSGTDYALTERQPQNFTGQRVNWPKSYIEIVDPTNTISRTNTSILLGIYYSDMETEATRKEKKATFKNRS